MITISWKFYVTILVVFLTPSVILFQSGRSNTAGCDASRTACSASCYQRLDDFLATLTEQERLQVQGQKKFISDCISKCDDSNSSCAQQSLAMYVGAGVLAGAVIFVFFCVNILASLRRRDEQHADAQREADEYKKLVKTSQREQKKRRERQVVYDPETATYVAAIPDAIAELAGVKSDRVEEAVEERFDYVTCPECGAVFTSEKAKLMRTNKVVVESLFCITCGKVIAGIV